jgi:hypothetical protein
VINIESQWWKVEVFSVYQVVAAEMQVRGRFEPTLNDQEPFVHLKNIATTPLLPGAPRLQNIADGQLSKAYFGVVRALVDEPPPADAPAEIRRRFLYFQGNGFTVKGQAEFPAMAEESRHAEMLFKQRFFPVKEVQLTVVGAEMAPLAWPLAYVNRDLMIGLYLA